MSREPVKPPKMGGLRIRARWFQVVGILIVLQFILGGLVSNDLIVPLYHIVLGFAVLAITLAILVIAVTSKASLCSLKLSSGVLLVLVFLQIPLGFAILDNTSTLLAVAHVLNAVAILLTTFASYFVARRWEKKSAPVE